MYRMHLVECSTGISTNCSSLVHCGEEAIWVRVVSTLLCFSIAHHKIPFSGEIHYNTYWTITVKDMLVSSSTGVSCYRQFCSIVTEFYRKHVCTSDTVKAVANK